MTIESSDAAMPSSQEPRLRRFRRVVRLVFLALGAYLLTAYVIIPAIWKAYEWQHPSLEDIPRITYAADGIPGDPLNVALLGTEAEVKAILKAAGWHPADPLGLRSDFEIAADTILKRPDEEAPVSNLFLFGRKEDLAYESPVGDSPRKRNHVRFWKSEKQDADGRPMWMGSATFDERVGFSHTTGGITHHIAPDVDAERDNLFHNLEQTKMLSETYFEDDFHEIREGRNGGGDPWHTDGRLAVGAIQPQ